MLEVSKSGYYAFKTRPKSLNRINNDNLLIEIRRVFWDNKRNYGSPRIWNQLRNEESIICSQNRVARLMRGNDIVAIHRRKFKATTNSKHAYAVWPNLLNCNFVVARPDNVWVSDIIYIWTYEGWLYLRLCLSYIRVELWVLLWIKR